ncbi:uncharacterized protein MELLADRAFT_102828 [Melampsora larici-populina 98AG31]|uniref:Uncharacterized protein n=1 Tax=Melampsora larici-populina (strain 98AG31 / pathotype 3-4-7) TaxID=747676 RepID=F4R9I6_MELLP|nr:uncharacterized protein MELLADRAFT_102828 [Melampsora larici-populina 98AG31]EGG11144.1 hypothetical protein MELLADRAFT_102828 [Melampsora larici-populina 98AG31]
MSFCFVTPAQARSVEYFVQCTSGGNMGQWTCKLCTGRTFADITKHSKLKTHIDRVRVELESRSVTVPPPGLASRASHGTLANRGADPSATVHEDADAGLPGIGIFDDGIEATHTHDLLDEPNGSSDELDSLYGSSPPKDVDFPESDSSVDLHDLLDGTSNSDTSSTAPLPEDEQRALTDAWLPWYPLRKKEHAAAMMMLGTGRNLMSTAEYTRIRTILRNILDVFLPDLGTRATASTRLRAMFKEKVIRQGLGQHLPSAFGPKHTVKVSFPKGTAGSDEPPRELLSKWPNEKWKKALQVTLESGQKALEGTFILVDFNPAPTRPICVGRVSAIWQQVGSMDVALQVKKCKLIPGLDPFYGMRELQETSGHTWICTQRLEAKNKRPEVTHKACNSFILNAGAHYSAEFHRNVTGAVWSALTADEWKGSITEGLSVWYKRCPPKDIDMDGSDEAHPEDDDPLYCPFVYPGTIRYSFNSYTLEHAVTLISFGAMSDWDDLFGEEMNVDKDDLGAQQPRETTQLRPSNSAMSITATADSPQTAPATLFRPPLQRNPPASASSRASASRASVKKYADLLKLTKENQEVLQKMIDNTLPGEEYLGTLSYLVFACQESKGLSGPKWVPGKVIRDAFKDVVAEIIFRPDLQAYSKTVADDHTTMVQSLEVLTFKYLKGLKAEYIDEHGPGDYIAGEACIPTTAMYLFIKDTLKNQRSKVRSALLHNILGVPEGSILKVPAAKSMALQVGRMFIPEVRALDDSDALAKLGRAKVKRIMFMRYVTVYYYLNQTENKKRCQWTLMDEVLADLRARPASDASLYFAQIARYDREAFTGQRTWSTIKASGLPAPFVDQVLVAGQGNNNALASAAGNDNQVGSSGSGFQGLEEAAVEEEEQNPSHLD